MSHSVDNDQAAATYNAELMAYVRAIQDEKRLHVPSCTATTVSPVCGSAVTIDLALNSDNTIKEVGYAIEACALTKTVLAIFFKTAPGMTANDIETGRRAFADFLENNAALPARWGELEILTPARDYRMRHASMLLPFDAALRALAKQS